MWLSPAGPPELLSGAKRPPSPVDSVGGSYTYEFPASPPLTMTTSTPMLEVQVVSSEPVTSIVTVRVPSVYVPSATGSTLSSIVPTGHGGFPAAKTGTIPPSEAGVSACTGCAQFAASDNPKT